MSSTFTSEFRQEFEAERERWLRKRVLWYLGVTLAYSLIAIVPGSVLAIWAIAKSKIPADQAAPTMLGLAGGAITTLMYAVAFLNARRRLFKRPEMLRFVVRLFVAAGLISILANVLAYAVVPDADPDAGAVRSPLVQIESDEEPGADAASTETPSTAAEPEAEPQESAPGAGPGARERNVRFSGKSITRPSLALGGLVGMFIGHVILCLFLPLTPRECFRPLIPLLAANTLVSAVFFPGIGWFAASIAFALVLGIPGAMICSWRDSRFHNRFQLRHLKQRYGEMRQELTDARRIHEALFPGPCLEGAVRMDYRYEPMRQIGGDYLYSRFAPSEAGPLPALHVVIVDVTGHGIPAALTVNRLHGEIERLFAEHPGATPGLLLQLLNRYVHLTLATHSVYVTALCIRVDPNPRSDNGAVGSLDWASGGHPPAFIRCIDGTIHRLDSTTFVLGACHGDDFKHHEQSIPFGPGDVVIAYTDGATEARDRTGRMLRIDGLQRIIAGVKPEGGSLSAAVLRAVEEFRFGPPADDTLVVEIARPVS